MNDSTSVSLKPIRLLFELQRADNPRLYDELIQFKKGSKRVNRLRTLAHEGLLGQVLPVGFARLVEEAKRELAPQDRDDALITTHVFDEPIGE